MAETPSDQSPARTQPAPTGSDPDPSSEYWCYHCDKRVAIETLADLPDVVCYECKNGFVESIPVPGPTNTDTDALGNQFIHVLRLIAQAARDDHAPPRPPSDPSDDDYLRIELDGWAHPDDEDEDDDYDDDDEDEHSVEVVNEEEDPNPRFDEESEVVEREEEMEEEEEADVAVRRRHDLLRLRLRDFATRAANRRNRILDWAEILMGLEDHPFELRLQIPESEYVGNPGDYVDAAGYEALLQNLAESDSGGRRGAPPASKEAVEGLESVVIGKEEEAKACAICKDTVNVGDTGKNLPCGHGYHGECIVKWLGERNSCPVCRFELPTDDVEYEEERRKRGVGVRAGSSSSGGGGGGDSGVE